MFKTPFRKKANAIDSIRPYQSRALAPKANKSDLSNSMWNSFEQYQEIRLARLVHIDNLASFRNLTIRINLIRAPALNMFRNKGDSI